MAWELALAFIIFYERLGNTSWILDQSNQLLWAFSVFLLNNVIRYNYHFFNRYATSSFSWKIARRSEYYLLRICQRVKWPFIIFNGKYTKGVPFLPKMVFKRVRGRTLGQSLPVLNFCYYPSWGGHTKKHEQVFSNLNSVNIQLAFFCFAPESKTHAGLSISI